jgi:hypothetical protein
MCSLRRSMHTILRHDTVLRPGRFMQRMVGTQHMIGIY